MTKRDLNDDEIVEHRAQLRRRFPGIAFGTAVEVVKDGRESNVVRLGAPPEEIEAFAILGRPFTDDELDACREHGLDPRAFAREVMRRIGRTLRPMPVPPADVCARYAAVVRQLGGEPHSSTSGPERTLTPAQRALCREQGIDPAVFAAVRDGRAGPGGRT